MLNRACSITCAAAFAIAGASVPTAPPAQAQTIDPSFNPAIGMADVRGIHLGPDNMYYVTGELGTSIGNGYIVRIDRDGQVDSSFDVDVDGDVLDIGFTGDKIVIAGDFSWVDGVRHDGLARLNADGSLDPGFGLPTGPGYYWKVKKIQILANGSIYAEASGFDAYVQRLHPDGSIDTSFDIAAVVGRSSPDTWLVRADGHLLWFGQYRVGSGSSWGDAFSEFDHAGNLLRTLDLPTVKKLVVGQDGDLLLLGDFPEVPDPEPEQPLVVIARFSDQMTRDWGFIPADLRAADIMDVAGLFDGRTLVAGRYHWADEPYDANSRRLGRLLPNGAPDPDWNELDFAPRLASLNTLLLELDGTILLGGDFTHANGASRNGIARIFMDDVEVPDPIFADGFEG